MIDEVRRFVQAKTPVLALAFQVFRLRTLLGRPHRDGRLEHREKEASAFRRWNSVGRAGDSYLFKRCLYVMDADDYFGIASSG